MLPHAKAPSKMTPRQEYLYGVGTARHAGKAVHRYTLALRWFKANAPGVQAQIDSASIFAFNSAWAHARGELRAHRWLLGFGQRVKAEGWKRLHPGPPGLASAWAWYYQPDTQCEVKHEGGWTSVNSAGYYGRFQMDVSFQRETPFGAGMYARYGTADHWPHWAQVYHAWEVWKYAGWGRWPPYRRYGCGG